MAFDVAAVEALAIAAARVFADGFRDLAVAAVEEVDAEHARLQEEERRLAEVRSHIGELLEQLAVDRQHFEEEKRRVSSQVALNNECGTEIGRLGSRRASHGSDALSLEELTVGAVVQGTVRNTGPLCAYVDIGAIRDGKLKFGSAKENTLRPAQVKSVVIDSIDLVKQEVKLALVQEADIAQQKSERDRGRAISAKAKEPNEACRSSSQKRSAEDSMLDFENHAFDCHSTNAVTLEELKIGAVVSGVVTSKVQGNVLLDLGASQIGRLRTSRETRKLQEGDKVDAIIDGVDLEMGHVVLALAELDKQQLEDPKEAAQKKERGIARKQSSRRLREASSSPPPKERTATRRSRPLLERPAPSSVACPHSGLELEPSGGSRDSPCRRPAEPKGHKLVAQRAAGRSTPTESLNSSTTMSNLCNLAAEVGDAAKKPRAAAPVTRLSGTSPRPWSRIGDVQGVRRKWGPPPRTDLTPLEKVVIGSDVSGVVNRCDQSGVYIDFGCSVSGHLLIEEEERDMFQPGDKVQGLLVEDVNLETQQVVLRQPED